MNQPATFLKFAKGHGTENDFVIVEDHHGDLLIDAPRVQALCDRRAGIGGDGLLRVIQAGALLRSGDIDQLGEGIAETDWFMDYRNADGSIAEMCGNGVRVFAHWIARRGLVADAEHGNQPVEFTVGTRAGAKHVTVHTFDQVHADVSVDMGIPRVMGVSTAFIGEDKFAGLGVDMGNPHLAAVVPGWDADRLAHLDFVQPVFDDEFFPQGVNVEIITPLQESRVNMRVYERGVGETRSCGTGTVAAAVAALADAQQTSGEITVAVPGGQVRVTLSEEGAILRGPSKIVATGETNL